MIDPEGFDPDNNDANLEGHLLFIAIFIPFLAFFQIIFKYLGLIKYEEAFFMLGVVLSIVMIFVIMTLYENRPKSTIWLMILIVIFDISIIALNH